MADPVVEVEGLRKAFGDHVAVDDVSFAVERGESLAIVGESGSGKTTVARMLVGLERPTAGSIRVCGRERTAGRLSTAERRRRAREMQIVFQDPYTSLHRSQTVAGCIGEVLDLHFGLRGAAPAWPRCSSMSASETATVRRTRATCPAGSASAWRSRGPWRPGPRC